MTNKNDIIEQIEQSHLQGEVDESGTIVLTGSGGHLVIHYETYVDDSNALDTVMYDKIGPVHEAFASDLLINGGVEIDLTGEWTIDSDGQYPTFLFSTKVLDGADGQRAMARWHESTGVIHTIDYGVKLIWNGWSIRDYTGLKNSEPTPELTMEEKLELAEARADRWEQECNQRVAELQELHARIRKIKSCPRYRLGESTLGPPMFAHQRGEWIKHSDMRNASALAFNEEHQVIQEKNDEDRAARKAAEIVGDDVFDGEEIE